MPLPGLSPMPFVAATPMPLKAVAPAPAGATAQQIADVLQPPSITASAAMDIVMQARQQPDCLALKARMAADQRALAIASVPVDPKAYLSIAMSRWGIFAICMPPVASMFLLSKSGLSGPAALIGLVGGFLGTPALALYLVHRHGLAQAREKQAEQDQARARAQSALQRSQQALDAAVKAATRRLWDAEQKRQAEAKQLMPHNAGHISADAHQVKLGKIVVSRRTDETAASAGGAAAVAE